MTAYYNEISLPPDASPEATEDALAASRALVLELVEALRPFAAYAHAIDADSASRGIPNECPIATDPTLHGGICTLGDLRRARAALIKATGGEK